MLKKLLSTGIILLFLVSLSAIHVEVGTNESDGYFIPFNGLWDYSWSRTVYLSSELDQSLELSGIGYYVTNSPVNHEKIDQKIYLRHTTGGAISSNAYVNPENDDSYELVYSGTLTYNGSGWFQIPFDTHFDYNGTDNLEVLYINNSGSSTSGYPRFAKSSSTGVNRASYKYAANTFPAISGSLVQYYPYTRFYFEAEGTPVAATLNAPVTGSLNVQLPVTLEWTSGIDTDSFAVYLSNNLNLVSTNDASALIAEDITATTLLVENLSQWTMYYWKVVSSNTISEYTNSSEIFSFTTETGDDLLIVGNGNLVNQGLPMEPSRGYTISQTIYRKEWLNVEEQRIEAISYDFNGQSAWTEDNVQIYMAHTDENQFATTSSWISNDDLVLVYDGPLSVPATEGWVEIILDTPFNYNNTQNLLIAFAANSAGSVSNSNEFFCTGIPTNQSMEAHSDGVNYNFIEPVNGILRNSYPNTAFTFGDIPAASQLSVFPESYTWEPTIMETQAAPVTFTMRNLGLGNLTINSVSLEAQAEFSITDVNQYPLGITTNAPQFTLNFHPATAGDFSANITIIDAENNETVVPLSGIGYDTMISEFPHLEGFETTSNNELPLDWSSIIVSTANAYINVSTATVYEGLKALRFSNSSDINPVHLKAVTPPIQDISSKRIKFYARGSTNNISLGVGTTNSNVDPESYNELVNFPLTTAYQRFDLNLAAAGDDDTMICLTYYGNNGANNAIYLDNLAIDQITESAYAEINPTTINFGNVNLNRAGIANINVQNWGSTDLVADFISADGLFTFRENQAIIPGNTTKLCVAYFNPVAEGAFSGSFVIETNADNAPSTLITATATVLPALPENVAIIGDGTLTNQGLPLEPHYRHSYSQSIYYANEIGIPDQLIEKISWYYNGFESWGQDNLRILMGTTTKTAFSGNADWVNLADLSEVFTGTIVVPAEAGWVETSLDIPFIYDITQNLVVAVHHSADSNHSNSSEFYCTTTPTTRSIVYLNDSNIPNPANPPAANFTRSSIPNVKFEIGELPEGAELIVTPTNIQFQAVPINGTSVEKVIRMRSIGLSDVVIANTPTITGAGADQFTISTDTNAYPLTLPSLAITTLGISFTPTTEGAKSATLEIVDNATRVTRVVNLSGYAYAEDGNDEPTGATLLTLPVNGDTYAIVPIGDVDWYKIPSMNIGDTLMIRTVATAESNITVRGWLYGPVTSPETIAGSSHIASGVNIEKILIASGDYYLRVAKGTHLPSPESQREDYDIEDSSVTRNNTEFYRLYVDAYYFYAFNAPINLQAHSRSGFVELSWIEPEYERYLVSYNIYRDGEQINSEPIPIGTNIFNDTDVIVGTEYNYYATGVYDEPIGQSTPSNSVTIIYFNEGEPIWGDDFENHPDFALDLPNWIQHDVDGGSTYGITGVEFANTGEPMSYIVFNPSTTTPPIGDMEPYDGDKFLASFASSAGANNDWIITPSIALGQQTVLSFYARSFSSEYGAEKFRVKMSFTGSEPADFQYTVHQGVDYLEAPTVWTPYYFNLNQLSGNTARFAIQCISEEAFVFMLDKFRIDGSEDTVANQDNSVAPVLTNLEQNYPNPFNPETTISYSLQDAGNVSVNIYNLKGQKVKTLVNDHREVGKHSIVWNGTDENNKNVSSGVYFYKMKSGKNSISRKMILMK